MLPSSEVMEHAAGPRGVTGVDLLIQGKEGGEAGMDRCRHRMATSFLSPGETCQFVTTLASQ